MNFEQSQNYCKPRAMLPNDSVDLLYLQDSFSNKSQPIRKMEEVFWKQSVLSDPFGYLNRRAIQSKLLSSEQQEIKREIEKLQVEFEQLRKSKKEQDDNSKERNKMDRFRWQKMFMPAFQGSQKIILQINNQMEGLNGEISKLKMKLQKLQQL